MMEYIIMTDIKSKWLDWTWTLAELFNHKESDAVIVLINQLRTQISGELNTDQQFQQLANIKEQALVLDHWTFTLPGVKIMIVLIIMVTGICIWKRCCHQQPKQPGSYTHSVPPQPILFN
jgi:hypothetical protein